MLIIYLYCNFQFFINKAAIDIYYILRDMQAEDNLNNNQNSGQKENGNVGFVNRDIQAKMKQTKKQIVFKIIRNDQQRQSLKMLTDLKNIFARQLPKMPKDYIVKLVFDRNHQSMVIVRQGGKVIGGICFRVFEPQKFAQVAFLAITANEQVRGYGTRLMNKLKQQMQRRKIQYLMTYADNLALGYFRKQGFSKDCRMSPQRWKGYIKDYEGGTMMECHVHPTIDYSRVSEIIRKQKQFVIQKIKQLSINQIKYQGKVLQNLPKDFIRKCSQNEEQAFKINPMMIPGVVQGGWTWNDHQQLKKTREVSFILQCQSILQQLKKQQASWPFRQPVSKEVVPDYETIVKEPIDLKTIQIKLASNQYLSKQSFVNDILRIFSNCRLYNQPDTVYCKCAQELEDYIRPHLNALIDGSLQVNELPSKKLGQSNSRKKLQGK